jgi:60 kDa SS-A/Ro ribonucleoprotein
MSDALKNYGTLATPQSESIPGKNQVKNNAGGYVYTIDHWTRLHRFLILGSDSGTYYVTERKLTVDNAACVLDCLKDDGVRAVQMAVEISQAGRAPKNDQAIFVLALALNYGEAVTDPERHSVGKLAYLDELAVRQFAAEQTPLICRTGTHIMQLATYMKNLGGWGEVKKRAINNWLFDKSADQLAYQMVKYRMREGWTHHDLHHIAHPRGDDKEGFNQLFKWAKGNDPVEMDPFPQSTAGEYPRIIEGYHRVQRVGQLDGSAARVAELVTEYKLPHEAIPTQYKNDPKVQDALLAHMPIGALVRNLGNYTKSGLLTVFSDAEKTVLDKLGDRDQLLKSRIHPMGILLALKTYESGKGHLGSGTWDPNSRIVDALNEAFYTTFDNVEPIGGNVMLALDVSGSMGYHHIGKTNLSCREASAAMAMVTARTEQNWMVGAFSTQFGIIPMSPTERLDNVVKRISNLPFGGTDCALPMMVAEQNEIPIDTFVVYTDNETWAGSIHPSQALVKYRRSMGKPNAKLVVVGMAATNFSIADPSDPGMLDVVGFDSAAPNVIAEFAREDS